MTTNLIKTTGRPMTAACLGMPAAALPVFAPVLGGFGGFGSGVEGSDLSSTGTGVDAIRVEGVLATWTIMRDERPMSAPVAAVAADYGYAYAASAGNNQPNAKQSPQHHAVRSIRGPEPWKERT
ncbi:hypothetical protein ABIA33_001235 [Streptacidiphilus sp. MAP12-16]